MISNLNQKVFHNELILEQIFKNLLQIRLVCRKWKLLIGPIISEEISVYFNSHKLISKQIKYFQTLKLSKVELAAHTLNLETATLINDALQKNWNQIKSLHIYGLDTSENYEMELINRLLLSLKNLQVLKLSMIDFPKFLQNIQSSHVFPNIRFLEVKTGRCGPFDIAEVPQNFGNIFPNLEKSLGDVQLDSKLLNLIQEGEISGWKITSFYSTGYGYNGFNRECLGLAELNKTPTSFLPFLRKLEIGELQEFDQEGADLLTAVLKQFSGTLEIVMLLKKPMKRYKATEQITVSIPPLPKVRKLVVGLPPFEIDPVFIWNLGKSMAKDFPLLEYFILKPNLNCFCKEEGTEEDCNHFLECHYTFREDCAEIWEPFVPFNCDEVDVDLSPLKSLIFVDLSIPSTWTGVEENREWVKRFLNVYLKLYGNGGRGPVQHMIDWLK